MARFNSVKNDLLTKKARKKGATRAMRQLAKQWRSHPTLPANVLRELYAHLQIHGIECDDIPSSSSELVVVHTRPHTKLVFKTRRGEKPAVIVRGNTEIVQISCIVTANGTVHWYGLKPSKL